MYNLCSMWKLHDYFISEDGGLLLWRIFLAEGLFMCGKCTLGGGVLILHAYDSIEPFDGSSDYEKWDRTEYFMTVTESGNVQIYNVSDGKPADDKVKSEIGTQVGCTLRFRQG